MAHECVIGQLRHSPPGSFSVVNVCIERGYSDEQFLSGLSVSLCNKEELQLSVVR